MQQTESFEKKIEKRDWHLLCYRMIAQIFGGINYKSAAKYYERIKQRCESNEKFKEMFAGLRQRCSQVGTWPSIFDRDKTRGYET